MNNHIAKLTSIGLSPSQAKCYLTFLQSGPLSVINAGDKLNLSRQASNKVVSSLVEIGLLKRVEVSGRKLYQAVSPEVLNTVVDRIAIETAAEVNVLKTLESGNTLPGINTYENPLAMREWYLQFMRQANNQDELLIWASGNKNAWYDLDSDFYKKYIDFSADKNVNTRVLLPNTKEAVEYQQNIGQKNADVRYIDRLPNQCEKWIWRDQVCFLTLDSNLTSMAVISSEKISDLEKRTFELAWLGAEKAGKRS